MRLTVCPATCTLSPHGTISLSHSGKWPIWAITSQPYGKSAQYTLSHSNTQTHSLYHYLYGTFPWTYTFLKQVRQQGTGVVVLVFSASLTVPVELRNRVIMKRGHDANLLLCLSSQLKVEISMEISHHLSFLTSSSDLCIHKSLSALFLQFHTKSWDSL